MKKILLFLSILCLLFFSACIQSASFEEGYERINGFWQANSFSILSEQLPHSTSLKKLSNSELSSLEEKLNNIETELQGLNQELESTSFLTQPQPLTAFIALNLEYVSFLKQEKQLLTKYSTQLYPLQKALGEFDDANKLFKKCNSSSLEETVQLMQEISVQAHSLNEKLQIFNNFHRNSLEGIFSEEEMVSEEKTADLLLLFAALKNSFQENCELQKNVLEWKRNYSKLLGKENLCAELDEFEALLFRAKQLANNANSLILLNENLPNSTDSSVLLTDLEETEIELQRVFYSLKVSCEE